MKNYFASQRDNIFRNVEVLIYVFDVESDELGEWGFGLVRSGGGDMSGVGQSTPLKCVVSCDECGELW